MKLKNWSGCLKSISLVIFCLILASRVNAFEGRIEYQVETLERLTPNLRCEVLLKNNFFKYAIYSIKGTLIRGLVVDYGNKKLTLQDGTKKWQISLEQDSNKNRIDPEETTSLREKKNILDLMSEKFESFYFIDKNRLRVESWYQGSLKATWVKHLWRFKGIPNHHQEMLYLVHPDTGQVALELLVPVHEKKPQQRFVATKITRQTLTQKDFEEI